MNYRHQYQGKTNDCAAYCAAIVCNAMLPTQLSGELVARGMERCPWRKIPGWVTLPWGLAGFLRDAGLNAELRFGGNANRLAENKSRDRSSIVFTAGRWWAHAKIYQNYDFGSLRRFCFVDPGWPEERSWQSEHQFMRRWRNTFRMYVEVENPN